MVPDVNGHEKIRPVRLRNYSKSITKIRKYENTKQDMEIKLLAFFGSSG